MPRFKRHWRNFIFYAAVFLCAALWFLCGADLPTSFTGKDEFFLGLRTPLEMMEKDLWLFPQLDNVPRLRKPPLLYWLGRMAYEINGVSLFSIRAVSCLLSALFIVAAVGIARHWGLKKSQAAVVALVIASSLGIATDAPRFMLDMPTAAFSALAFWCVLKTQQQKMWIFLAAFFLACGFLTKGPIVFLLCGAGILALILSGIWNIQSLIKNAAWIISAFAFWAILALPWFVAVKNLYPETARAVFNDEIAAREIFKLHFTLFSGFLVVTMPWFFIGLVAIFKTFQKSTVNQTFFSKKYAVDRGKLLRFCVFWLVLTLIPFLFVRTFERYLLGAVLPFSLLLFLQWENLTNANWARRLGMLLAIFLGLFLAVFVLYFQKNAHVFWLFACAAILLFFAFWQQKPLAIAAAASLIFWKVLLVGVFPAIAVNAVPPHIINLAKTQDVVFFEGPQPAMLSILSGKTHLHLSKWNAKTFDELAKNQKIIFLSSDDFPQFIALAQRFNHQFQIVYEYKTLASKGSGLRFARAGENGNHWLWAIAMQNPEPLMLTIYAIRINP